MSAINPGDVVKVFTLPPFTDVDGNIADPSEVRIRWRVGSGPSTVWIYGTDSEVVKIATGSYRADIEIKQVGRYYFRWEGEGGVTAAEESYFDSGGTFGDSLTVLPAAVDDGQAYLTPDRLRSMRTGQSFTGWSDLELFNLIDEASAIADAYCLVPLNSPSNAFLGGRVTENHRWRYPQGMGDTAQRKIYPLHKPIRAVQSMSIIVGHGAAAAIPTSSLVIDNDHGWVAVTSLTIASNSGLFSVEGWIVPIGGLQEPMAEITYDYGWAITETDEAATPIDGGRKAFQTRHGCWTIDSVTVKSSGVTVAGAGYSLDRSTGRVIFLESQPGRVTVSYVHKLTRDIPIAVGFIAAALGGSSRIRERGLTGLKSLRVNEIAMVKESAPVHVDATSLDATVPEAAQLLNGYRHWRIGTA